MIKFCPHFAGAPPQPDHRVVCQARPGEYSSHYVWQLAVGPDYRQGVIVTDPVNRRDVAPTLVYALCGGPASHATGHVRTQMFKEEFWLPVYTATPAARTLEPNTDLEGWQH